MMDEWKFIVMDIFEDHLDELGEFDDIESAVSFAYEKTDEGAFCGVYLSDGEKADLIVMAL